MSGELRIPAAELFNRGDLGLIFGNALDVALLLTGPDRKAAVNTLCREHYTASVPSGKSHFFQYREALVVFSIPANKNIGEFLLGYAGSVWELTRLWAPDGHEPNLLTQAIKYAVRSLRLVEPGIEALVSYADPNAGHTGGVYRAASWIYHGQSEESRAYYSTDGHVKARRAFHSGKRGLSRVEIEAQGYTQRLLPGKFRFVKPLTYQAKRSIKSLKNGWGIHRRTVSDWTFIPGPDYTTEGVADD